MQLSKFILGTAQFNGIYGVSNNKKLSFKEIEKIIINSSKQGINIIEICSTYGDSQEKIYEIILDFNTLISAALIIFYRFYIFPCSFI